MDNRISVELDWLLERVKDEQKLTDFLAMLRSALEMYNSYELKTAINDLLLAFFPDAKKETEVEG